MIEIAGGILLAVVILATMPLWLPVLLWLLVLATIIGVAALAIMFPEFGIALLAIIFLFCLMGWLIGRETKTGGSI